MPQPSWTPAARASPSARGAGSLPLASARGTFESAARSEAATPRVPGGIGSLPVFWLSDASRREPALCVVNAEQPHLAGLVASAHDVLARVAGLATVGSDDFGDEALFIPGTFADGYWGLATELGDFLCVGIATSNKKRKKVAQLALAVGVAPERGGGAAADQELFQRLVWSAEWAFREAHKPFIGIPHKLS